MNTAKPKEFQLQTVKSNTLFTDCAPVEELLLQSIARRLNLKEEHFNLTKKVKRKVVHLSIDDHAWERWNERIGPVITIDELNKWFTIIFREPERVIFMSREHGVIDNEILFTYEKNQNTLTITTFYGRISLQPALSDFNYLKYFNERHHDKLGLAESDEVLSNQFIPPLPVMDMHYKGRWNEYKMEEYRLPNGNNLLVIIKLRGKTFEQSYSVVSLEDQSNLGKSGKKALRLWGKIKRGYVHQPQ